MRLIKVIAGAGAAVGAVALAPIVAPVAAAAALTAAGTAAAAAGTVAAAGAAAAGTAAAAAGTVAAAGTAAAGTVAAAAGSTAIGSAVITGATAATSAVAASAVGGAVGTGMAAVGGAVGAAAGTVGLTSVATVAGTTAGATAVGAITTSGVIGVSNAISGASKMSRASDVAEEAKSLYAKSRKAFDQNEQETNAALEELGKQKLTIWDRFAAFEEQFNKIQNLEISGGAVREKALKLDQDRLRNVHVLALSAREALKGGLLSLSAGQLAGAAAASGITSVATASTGTAIASLHGAAAYNASMAALGGGALNAGGLGMAGGAAVANALVFAPAMAVGGILLNGKGKKSLRAAQDSLEEAQELTRNMEEASVQLKALRFLCEELSEILAVYDSYLISLIAFLEALTARECNAKNYTEDEITKVYASYRVVEILYDLTTKELYSSTEDEITLNTEGVMGAIRKSDSDWKEYKDVELAPAPVQAPAPAPAPSCTGPAAEPSGNSVTDPGGKPEAAADAGVPNGKPADTESVNTAAEPVSGRKAGNGTPLVSVVKGQKTSLSSLCPGLKKIDIGIGWTLKEQHRGREPEFDATAFLLDSSGRCPSEELVAFYGQTEIIGGSLKYREENGTALQPGADRRRFEVDLSRIPPEIQMVAITVSIYEAEKRSQSFGMLSGAFLRIMEEGSDTEMLRYDFGEHLSQETAVVFGEIYRRNGEWRFNAVGSGMHGGLAALCGQYGVEAE